MKNYPVVLLAVVTSVLVSTSALGAAGVVESQDFVVGGQGSSGALTSAASGQAAGSSDALVMLLDQFNAMRGELETLRSIIEEQTFELSRLRRDSLDRYTDLDARVSALYEDDAQPAGTAVTPSAASTSPPSVAPPAAISGSANREPAQPAADLQQFPSRSAISQPDFNAGITAPSETPAQPRVQPQLMTEQQLYQLALDSLLQEEQYQRSISEFDLYLQNYPSGRFITNAYYWKGQAYVNLSLFPEARDAFEVIVQQYPDGRKVDDAMYSLGTVYDRLGNRPRAREILQEVRVRYPNTSAANLADIYLRAMN